MVSSLSRAWHLLVVTTGLFIALSTPAGAQDHTGAANNGGN